MPVTHGVAGSSPVRCANYFGYSIKLPCMMQGFFMSKIHINVNCHLMLYHAPIERRLIVLPTTRNAIMHVPQRPVTLSIPPRADELSQVAHALLPLIHEVHQTICFFYHLTSKPYNQSDAIEPTHTKTSSSKKSDWHQAIGLVNKADHSPLTEADLAANAQILHYLAALTPDIPIYSEESLPSQPPVTEPLFWLIDPLDGTREFVRRTDQFTVNIALILAGKPILGIISAPVFKDIVGAWNGQLYEAVSLKPALLASHWQPLDAPAPRTTQVWNVTIPNDLQRGRYQEVLDALTQNQPINLVRAGSAYKFIQQVRGLIDFYPRLHPTQEWDTAAGQALLEAIGGALVDAQGEPFQYGVRRTWLNQAFFAVTHKQDIPKVLDIIQSLNFAERWKADY